MSGTIRQICSVTEMSLRSLPLRFGSSMVIVIGIAGTMAVLLSVLAIVSGVRGTLQNAGRDDRVVVLRAGSAAELGSALTREAVRELEGAAGIARDESGALISPELMGLVSLLERRSRSEVNVTLRGLTPGALRVRPEIKLTSGRWFEPGLSELVVGRSAQQQFEGLDLDKEISINGTRWRVVGVFASGGDARESELLADAGVLMSENAAYQSVTAKLTSPQAFTTFKDWVSSNPALSVDVQPEREYLARRSTSVTRLVFFVAYVVGGIMAIGAVFAAVNSMYASVSTRTREIATLRALGFGGGAMVIAVLVEALVLALIGGLTGGLIAWLLFSGRAITTSLGNLGVSSQLVFELAVTPALFAFGLIFASCIGLLGAFFPALRAARQSVTDGLRAL